MKNCIKIGNAQAFWGDSQIAPQLLLKQQPDLDYLTLDYLAEVSLSIMAIQREKDPALGYAKDFISVVESLIPFWQKGFLVKIITNAGGLNPEGCAEACISILNNKLKKPLRIFSVSGDDLLAHSKSSSENPLFRNMDTNSTLETVKDRLVSANAYLGADPIVEALRQGADIVITGRTADPSLTVASCIAHFNWKENQYDKIAQATVAGHLIECGTQATGGISTHWLELSNNNEIGFPVIEMAEDSSFIITKPLHTGGEVSIKTVKEQLLYEIGDPDRYLSPDITLSILSLKLAETGKDRIKVSGAAGSPPPSTYKVSATYRDGFRSEGTLLICGPQSKEKAGLCGKIILERMEKFGKKPARSLVEFLGSSEMETVLRITVADPKAEVLEFFSKELASLVTCGPQGVTGYISGRPHIRPVFGYWPCLIEREFIKPVIKEVQR